MVIPKIGITNVQLIKDTFATRKQYHLKLSTHKFIILNFQLLKKLATRKIKFLNFQLVKHNLQQKNYLFKFSTRKKHLATYKSNLQLVVLFPTRKINFQLVKLFFNS